MTDIIQKTRDLIDKIRLVSYEIEQTSPALYSQIGGKLAVINLECKDILKEINKTENKRWLIDNTKLK